MATSRDSHQRTRWREPPVISEEPLRPTPSYFSRRRHWSELEDMADERDFFSPEFYEAFPDLRRHRGSPRPTFPHSRPLSSNANGDNFQFTSYLDRFDSNWRNDPFWRDLYPRWAEPIFKDGLDVKTNIVNNDKRFAVEIDCYQFRPEELQVKTLDDTLLIEGRHENVKDPDNYTKMYFVRKYQLPFDVEPHTISSSIDGGGRLIIEAGKRPLAIENRERAIPIESSAIRASSRASGFDSGRGSANDYFRVDSPYLSPNKNGYRTAYESRETNGNGLRHEARREQFREEVRRTGSHQNIPPPISPIRSEAYQNQNGAYERSFHRSASSSRNEFRSADVNGDNLLRPARELDGGQSGSRFGNRSEERTIRINRS